MAAGRAVVAAAPTLERNYALMLTIPSIGPVTAPTVLTEVPNIAEFTPKGLAALAGLSPQEHSPGSIIRRLDASAGSECLRRALYMCSLSGKQRNPALSEFVRRMITARKPPKVLLPAIARKLPVFAIESLGPRDGLLWWHLHQVDKGACRRCPAT